MFVTRRALLRTLEREREAFAAERARLIDTICALAAGQPLTLLPPTAVPVQEPVPEFAAWTQTPEQEPPY